MDGGLWSRTLFDLYRGQGVYGMATANHASPRLALHYACATEGRKATGVDPELKAANLKRLRRIEGQIRGLQRMVEEERYCADIIVQVA